MSLRRVGILIAFVMVLTSFLISTPDAASTLVMGYPFDEGSGSIAYDVSGSNKNATHVNAPSWTSAGKFGGAVTLNGSSQYIQTNSPNLPTGDFTWALWINRRSNQGFQTLMEAQGSTRSELELDLEEGVLSIWSSGVHRFTTAATVPANTWTHVALTRSGEVLRAYINGVADQRTGSDSRTLDFSSCPLLVGVDADSGCVGSLNGYLQADIDEVQVHSGAASTAEIQQMMASPLAGGGADTTAPVRSTSQSTITLPAGTTQTTISLTTNEPATCRYSLTSGVPYSSMSGLFSSTGTTAHSYTVSGLSDGSTRTYRIKCQDAAGNANADDFPITVTVANPGAPAPPPPPQTTTFYVSPGGNDQNPGTLQQPFQTIGRARQAVRAINGSMSNHIQVFLRGGEYNLTTTEAFDRLDSGTNGFSVIYAAYPGEQPVIHGGQHVTGWTAVGGGIYKAQVGQLRFRQLYVNGKRAVRARKPDADSYNQIVFWDTTHRRVQVGNGQTGNWQRENQVEMIILGAGVNQSNLRVSSISGSTVTPLEPERTRIFQQTYPPKGPGVPYYFENAMEFLDKPGEWYLNTDTGEVFYMPRSGENLATADVVVPRVERLVGVTGTLSAPVRNIQFRNLTFAYTTWLLPSSEGFVGDQASVIFTQPLPDDEITSYPGHRHPGAVHVDAADNIVFERNVFSHLGSSGLNLYSGTHDNRVIGNAFTDISASGISVGLDLQGNPADSRQVSRRTVIQNNYLSETGLEFYQSVGIMVGYGDAVLVEHNELSKMPYSGITVGWGWADEDNAARNNMVRYNEIRDVLKKMSDGGGIYTLSRQPGTFIAENYVHDIVRTGVQGGFNISGIYLDEGSSFITVRDNVLQNTGDRGIFQNANGPNNFLTNNGGQSSSTMMFAGLESAYENIRPGSTPPGDTTAPVRSNAQPTALLPAGTSQALVSLSTNESAICRYATTSGVAFGAMPNVLSTTNGTSHTTLAIALSDGGSYPYFIRCQDGVGNANNDDFQIIVAVASVSPTGSVAVPVISPNGGAFSVSVSVSLTTSTTGASIRYTTDGTDPTTGSTLYTSPFTLSSSVTLRARAFKAGLNDSAVASATFVVTASAPAGLVGAFAFSEGSGTQTLDTSSNGNVGLLRSGIAWTAQGKSGSAVTFDGLNDYVEVSSPDLPTGDFTWQAWIKGTQWRSFQAIMMGGDDVGPELTIDGSGRVVVVHDAGQRLVSASSIPLATWTHVAMTRSGGFLRIYLNGAQDTVSSTSQSPLNFGSCPLLIGVDADSGCAGELNGYFSGTLDEVRAYNRALSTSEIQQEMSRP